MVLASPAPFGGAGVHVLEVERPTRSARRRAEKSDQLDAYRAARAVPPVTRNRTTIILRFGLLQLRTMLVHMAHAADVAEPIERHDRPALSLPRAGTSVRMVSCLMRTVHQP